MSESFELDHHPLATDPALAGLATVLRSYQHINSPETFNAYCREAYRAWRVHCHPTPPPVSARFEELLARIQQREVGTIMTLWGGVVITRHEHPHVEKLLVVHAGGYLALEKHAEKDERLEVCEGAGLLLSRKETNGPLVVEALAPGKEFHFEPGTEHCIIGTENLLVFERGTDPKGMDQDLIFLYEPDGAG